MLFPAVKLKRIHRDCGTQAWFLHLRKCLYVNELLWVCLWHHPKSGKSTPIYARSQTCLIFSCWHAIGKREARGAKLVCSEKLPHSRLQGDKLNCDCGNGPWPRLIYFPLPIRDKRSEACHTVVFGPVRTLLNIATRAQSWQISHLLSSNLLVTWKIRKFRKN